MMLLAAFYAAVLFIAAWSITAVFSSEFHPQPQRGPRDRQA